MNRLHIYVYNSKNNNMRHGMEVQSHIKVKAGSRDKKHRKRVTWGWINHLVKIYWTVPYLLLNVDLPGLEPKTPSVIYCYKIESSYHSAASYQIKICIYILKIIW